MDLPLPHGPLVSFFGPSFMKKDTFLSIWYAVAVCDMKYTFFMNVNVFNFDIILARNPIKK